MNAIKRQERQALNDVWRRQMCCSNQACRQVASSCVFPQQAFVELSQCFLPKPLRCNEIFSQIVPFQKPFCVSRLAILNRLKLSARALLVYTILNLPSINAKRPPVLVPQIKSKYLHGSGCWKHARFGTTGQQD